MQDKSINDCHIHIGRSAGINQSMNTPEHLCEFRERYNIDKMLVFSFEHNVDVMNKMLEECGKQYDWMKPLYWLNKTNTLKELNGFIGCKFHGHYDNLPITSSHYESTLELLDSKRGILLVHCGRYLEAKPESNTSYLHALGVAETYPHIKVIMGHMGGSDTTIIKQAISDCAMHNNIYYDTSGITTPYAIEFAVERLHHNKILFGSDSPWCSFRAMLANIEDAQIPEQIKNAILYDNMERLLNGK